MYTNICTFTCIYTYMYIPRQVKWCHNTGIQSCTVSTYYIVAISHKRLHGICLDNDHITEAIFILYITNEVWMINITTYHPFFSTHLIYIYINVINAHNMYLPLFHGLEC
jgi:hypothetical protein